MGLGVSFHPYSNRNSTGGGGANRRRGSEGRGSERAALREGVAGHCLAQGGPVGNGMAGNPDRSPVSLRSLFVA